MFLDVKKLKEKYQWSSSEDITKQARYRAILKHLNKSK